MFKLIDHVKIDHNELVNRYNSSKFKKGNVGLICLLHHLESGKKLVVVNSHIHWNSSYDFVKFGQGFWLLKSLSDFLIKH